MDNNEPLAISWLSDNSLEPNRFLAAGHRMELWASNWETLSGSEKNAYVVIGYKNDRFYVEQQGDEIIYCDKFGEAFKIAVHTIWQIEG